MDKGRLQTLIAGLPVGLMVSAAFGLIALVGITFTLVELSTLAAEESWRANTEHQRAIIDAKTGIVSGLKEDTGPAFDVGDKTIKAPDMGEVTEHEAQGTAELSGELPRLRETPNLTSMPSIPRSPASLLKAPAPEATEQRGELTLPMKTAAGLTPARLYARNFTRKEDERLLAIVITDAGFSADALDTIITLPKEVSVAFSPYAPSPGAAIEAVRNAGHEAWVMLPTMTDNYPEEDPGPLGLVSTQAAESVQSRVQQIMAATMGAVGFVLPPEETITPHEQIWNVAFTEIDGRGLLTLATRVDRSIDQLVPDKKRQDAVRRADLILDSTPSTAFIRSKLAVLAGQITASPKDMIVVASARPQTLAILNEWLKEQQGFTLAPLSAVYRSYEPPPEPPAKKSGGHGGGH